MPIRKHMVGKACLLLVSVALQMLVEAETPDGVRHSTLLQNAETVRLVCPTGSAKSSNGGGSSSSPSKATGGQLEQQLMAQPLQRTSSTGAGQAWQAVSVSSLQPGQQVFLLMQAGARHTGISIQEQIKEC